MPDRLQNLSKFVITVCLMLTVGLIAGEAQTKKKKRTRRSSRSAPARPVITNPTVAPPATAATETPGTTTTGDVKIISESNNSADSGEQLQGWKPKAAAPSQTAAPEAGSPSGSNSSDMQNTINNLSNQVNRLNEKLTQMQEDDRYQLDMERLTRAEQRAEQLRSQLIDVQGKIADLEAQLEQIEYALKPENIDRATQGYGTVHPEEARDARRRQLESQKSRTEAQLKILQTSQTRLETSVANADNEVDTLRARLEQRRLQMDATPPQHPTAPTPRKPEQPEQ